MQRVTEFLERIAKNNSRINALVAVTTEADLARRVQTLNPPARDDEPLVYIAKDNFCTLNMTTTCASNILKGFVSPYEATAVKQLRELGGGILLAKANMDEFAMGCDNSYSCFGQTLNPLYSESEPTSPGGSSGGSAAAVAAGFCDVALGTDTGGSIRLPAAYCSVVGFKPTYGRLSRHGVVAFAQSLDTVGILAPDMTQTRRAFAALDHPDPKDPTCASAQLRERFTHPGDTKGPRKLKIGVIEETILAMDPEIREAWVTTMEKLAEVHDICVVSVPSLRYALPTYFAIAPSEASSNLARFDGIRYGDRAADDVSLEGVLYGPTRTEGFGAEVQRRILLGTFNMTANAYEEHFIRAQRVRRIICNELDSLFRREHPLLKRHKNGFENLVDVCVLPTSAKLPPRLGHTTDGDPVEHYLHDILTVPANLAGLPAISLPVGSKSVGIQVWGQFGDDATVMNVAEEIMRQTV